MGLWIMERATEMRERQTRYEAAIWQHLQKRGFEQQVVFGGKYIVDFYHPKTRIVVEIDGSYHFTPEGKAADAQRTRCLRGFGVRRVMRFSNAKATRHTQECLAKIDEAIALNPKRRRMLKSACVPMKSSISTGVSPIVQFDPDALPKSRRQRRRERQLKAARKRDRWMNPPPPPEQTISVKGEPRLIKRSDRR